jgi:hypothetical protein
MWEAGLPPRRLGPAGTSRCTLIGEDTGRRASSSRPLSCGLPWASIGKPRKLVQRTRPERLIDAEARPTTCGKWVAGAGRVPTSAWEQEQPKIPGWLMSVNARKAAKRPAAPTALFSTGKQDVRTEEDPERIVGDERDLDEYADEREQRDEQRDGEFHMQCTFPQANSMKRRRVGDSGILAAEAAALIWLPRARDRATPCA